MTDSGGKGKSKQLEKNGTKKSKEREEEGHFPHPFRLSLAPTICPWVSEDGFGGIPMIISWECSTNFTLERNSFRNENHSSIIKTVS